MMLDDGDGMAILYMLILAITIFGVLKGGLLEVSHCQWKKTQDPKMEVPTRKEQAYDSGLCRA